MRPVNANLKTINKIFCVVGNQKFKRISKCTTRKEAWLILETSHEGTNTMKQLKLQILTTKFKTYRILGNETISDFYARMCDMSNQSFDLENEYLNSKLVRKVF
uniref:Uncharacterized protein n=1 Tax=Gossypium raimondii TaxID=29730 RepID=A0A0D2TM79_GOSRA|nr:hypothetical protein B456_007G269000 [Gossypium raimondii]